VHAHVPTGPEGPHPQLLALAPAPLRRAANLVRVRARIRHGVAAARRHGSGKACTTGVPAARKSVGGGEARRLAGALTAARPERRWTRTGYPSTRSRRGLGDVLIEAGKLSCVDRRSSAEAAIGRTIIARSDLLAVRIDAARLVVARGRNRARVRGGPRVAPACESKPREERRGTHDHSVRGPCVAFVAALVGGWGPEAAQALASVAERSSGVSSSGLCAVGYWMPRRDADGQPFVRVLIGSGPGPWRRSLHPRQSS
jgi:hypothetical protein